MARTQDQIMTGMMGTQMFQIAGLQAERERLIEDVAKLKAENTDLKTKIAALSQESERPKDATTREA